MKARRIYLPAMATALLMSTALAGCGKEETTGSSAAPSAGASVQASPSPAASAAPTSIKAMTILFGNPPSTDNNKAKADIEKRGNVKLDITFVPSEAYKDKLSVAISAGDSYDILLLDGGKDDKFTSLVKMGAFHELTPYLKTANNINKLDENVWNNVRVQGKVYGIPRPRGLYGGGEASVIIRKDWLDKYGLAVPKTLDELTKALETFKKNDPAGGGKTIPFTMYAADTSWTAGPFGGTQPISYAFGVPTTWKLDGGKAVRDFQTPEYKSYLDWLKDSWSKGLLDKDAPVLKNQGQARNKFQAGVAGAFVGNVSEIAEENIDKLKQSDPKAEIAVIDLLEGAGGKKGVAVIAGYYGLWAIPSSVPKDKVQKIVDFLNFTASEENYAFYKAGITGVHNSEIKNGIASQTDEQKKLFDLEKPNQFILQNMVDPYIYANAKTAPVIEKQKASLDVISKAGIASPFQSYTSQTAAKNPDTYKKLGAAMTKYVLGESQWTDVQKEIDAWTTGLGAQITKDLLDQYNEDHK